MIIPHNCFLYSFSCKTIQLNNNTNMYDVVDNTGTYLYGIYLIATIFNTTVPINIAYEQIILKSNNCFIPISSFFDPLAASFNSSCEKPVIIPLNTYIRIAVYLLMFIHQNRSPKYHNRSNHICGCNMLIKKDDRP